MLRRRPSIKWEIFLALVGLEHIGSICLLIPYFLFIVANLIEKTFENVLYLGMHFRPVKNKIHTWLLSASKDTFKAPKMVLSLCLKGGNRNNRPNYKFNRYLEVGQVKGGLN